MLVTSKFKERDAEIEINMVVSKFYDQLILHGFSAEMAEKIAPSGTTLLLNNFSGSGSNVNASFHLIQKGNQWLVFSPIDINQFFATNDYAEALSGARKIEKKNKAMLVIYNKEGFAR